MAYTKEPLEDIALLLDYAEVLPRLLAVNEDTTVTFREYLVAITERFPQCSYILKRFDDSDPELTWW